MIKKCLFALIFTIIFSSCQQDPEDLNLWQIHSLRGNIHPLEVAGKKTGGFALMNGAYKTYKNPRSLNVMVGVYNMYFGTPEAYFSEGQAVIDLMNKTGFDLLLVGVRELYFGPEVFIDLAARAKFPFISTNLRDRDAKPLAYVKPYWQSQGKKWMILNLTPNTFLSQNIKSHVENLSLVEDIDALDQVLKTLDPQHLPESILVAGGYTYTPSMGPSPELQKLLDHPLAKTILLGATSLETDGIFEVKNSAGEERTLVAQFGGRLMNGGVLESLSLNPHKSGTIKTYSLSETQVEPDPDLGDALAEIRHNLDRVMAEPIAEIPKTMTHTFDDESEVGNLMSDVFRNYLETDIFLLNSGTLRSNLEQGQLSKYSLYQLIPFGGNLVKISIKGRDLLPILVRSFSFLGHPEKGRGFLQVSGITTTWNPKLSNIKIQGKPLDPDRLYTLGTTAYLLSGGDGYQEIAQSQQGQVLEDPASLLSIAMSEFKKMKILTPPGLGRFQSP